MNSPKFSNVLVFPLSLLMLNSVACIAICFLARSGPGIEQRFAINIGAFLFYLSSTAILLVHARKLVLEQIEPKEEAISILLTALPDRAAESTATSEWNDKLLSHLATAAVNEIENLRQATEVIADHSSDILCSVNEALRICELNASAERIWHFQNISLIGTSIINLAIPTDRTALQEYFESSKEGVRDQAHVWQVKTASGAILDLSWSIEWSNSLRTFYCVGTDISALKQVERLRAEITAMVGHDLRAPVSAMSFFIEGLLANELGTLNEKGTAQLLRCKENVQQMLRLISQLLDAEKIEAGEIEVDVKIVPVSAIVESSVNLVAQLAEKKNQKIVSEESSNLVFADFDRSVQILTNLLSNAIKFSPEASTITVKETVSKELVSIEVIDQGPGIAVEHFH